MSFRPGAGLNGSDRITITFVEGIIKNIWLRVTVFPTFRTGLAAPDVFYFGNLIGETGDSATSLRVNALDLSAVKRALNGNSIVAGRFDFNRDGRVNALDLAAVRGNLNRALPVLAPPAAAAQAVAPARVWDETAQDLLGR